ncbi:hypothetical protein HJFPF1_11803 [Paramyrothecium foliicola]|nr:hypothetical protein HJFPF1_11803 [Paramyrothecium foliicola]
MLQGSSLLFKCPDGGPSYTADTDADENAPIGGKAVEPKPSATIERGGSGSELKSNTREVWIMSNI